MKPLLEVRNLTVRYATNGAAVTAVRDVSFELAPGRAIGLVGKMPERQPQLRFMQKANHPSISSSVS